MALVLTRRKGERIRIGDDVVVTIHAISGNAVQVAIEAPKEVPILREEVYLRAESLQYIDRLGRRDDETNRY